MLDNKINSNLPSVQLPDSALSNTQLTRFLTEKSIELGPVFELKSIGDILTPVKSRDLPLVVMVGPEANKFVLHTHAEHFSHELGWSPLIESSLGKGLINMDGEEHKKHNKIWTPAFSQEYMKKYWPIMKSCISEYVEDWRNYCTQEVDVLEETRRLSFDLGANLLAGYDGTIDLNRLRQLLNTIIGADSNANVQDILKSHFELMMLHFMHINNSKQNTKKDLLGLILQARDESGNNLKNEQIIGHLNILLAAGYETTSLLMAWTLYCLALYKEYTAEILEEVKLQLGDTPFESIELQQIKNLKNLNNFILEVGRLYSPILSLPRGVVKEFTFNGYTIPAGCLVHLAIGATHRLSHIFHEPDRFDPQRFEPPYEEGRVIPYALATFGGGERKCIGANLATLETKIFVIEVLKRYQLELAPVTYTHPPIHKGVINAMIVGPIKLLITPKSQTGPLCTSDVGTTNQCNCVYTYAAFSG